MTETVYILIGSNVGDREKILSGAVQRLSEIPGNGSWISPMEFHASLSMISRLSAAVSRADCGSASAAVYGPIANRHRW